MTVLNTLNQRQSVKADLLGDPAPSDVELQDILQAGMSAPDHGAIRPWRFKVIRGDDRLHLADLFASALLAKTPDADEEAVANIRSKPMRSPLIVAICAEIMEDHPKVPPVEQIVATACATQNILLAANAKGYGAVLLSGWPAHDLTVKEGLGLQAKDEIVGFLYLGTPTDETREKKRPEVTKYISHWPENS